MKHALILLLVSYSSLVFSQTTYTYSGTGDWSTVENWSPSYPGTTVAEEDHIIIPKEANVTSSILTINGSFLVEGSFTINSILTTNGKVINNGIFRTRSTFIINDTLINNADHANGSSTNLNGVFINKGSFSTSSTFTNYGVIINDSTFWNRSTVKNYGEFINRGVFNNSSTLAGNNISHTGNLVLQQSLRPEKNNSRIGTYTFNNNLSFNASSRINMEVTKDSTDKVVVGDTLNLSDGKLFISLLRDTVLPLGYRDTLFEAKKIIGFFAETNLPDLGDYELFLECTETAIIAEVRERYTSFTYTGIGDWKEAKNWFPRYPGNGSKADEEIIIADTAEVSTSFITLNGPLIIKGTVLTSSTFTLNGKVTIEETGNLTTRSTTNVNDTLVNLNSWLARSSSNINGVVLNKGFWSGSASTTNNGVIINDSTISLSSTFSNNGELINNVNSEFGGSFNLNGANVSHVGEFNLTRDLTPQRRDSKIGVYTFNNAVTFDRNSRLIIDYTKDSIDAVIVKDTVSLFGQLVINLLEEDSLPNIGFKDTILTAAFIEGTFEENLPELDSTKNFSVAYTDTTIILEVVSSEPIAVENEHTKTSFELFPNPVKNKVWVAGITAIMDCEVYSTTGTLVKRTKISPSKNSIDLSEIEKGVYFISLDKETYRFVKE